MRVVVAGLAWRIREDTPHPEFLIMKRPPDAPFFPNVWVAPGGGVELTDLIGRPDQFGAIALYREFSEEVGDDFCLDTPRFFGERAFIREDGTGVVVLTYLCRHLGGTPKITTEAVEFAWVTDTEALAYDLIGDTASEISQASAQLAPF